MNFSVFMLNIPHIQLPSVIFPFNFFFIFIFLELIFLKSSSPFFLWSRPKYGVEISGLTRVYCSMDFFKRSTKFIP